MFESSPATRAYVYPHNISTRYHEEKASTVCLVAESTEVAQAIRHNCQPSFSVEVVASLDDQRLAGGDLLERADVLLLEWTKSVATWLSTIIHGHGGAGWVRYPIVALCAPGEAKGITALMMGADFAVRPPVHTALLNAILAAFHRRRDRTIRLASTNSNIVDNVGGDAGRTAHLPVADGKQTVEASPAHILQVGPLSVDERARTAHVDDEPLELTQRPFDLLHYLVQHLDECCTRDEMLNDIWGLEFDPSTNVIDVQIYTIRNALRRVGLGGMIKTVRGHGYRLRWPI